MARHPAHLIAAIGAALALLASAACAQTIPDLPAGAAVSAGDLLATAQGGSRHSAKVTAAQVAAMAFDTGVPGIPGTFGTNGRGFLNSSFAIQYAPASAANSIALEVNRTDTWTGGISGQVTSAVHAHMSCPAGRKTYCATVAFVLDNSSTRSNGGAGDGAENAALLAYVFKHNTGISFGADIGCFDQTGTSSPLGDDICVASEFDVDGDGPDPNETRFGITLQAENNSGVGTAVIAAAASCLNQAGSQWISCFQCKHALFTAGGSCLTMADGEAIDFGQDVFGRYILHGSGVWAFQVVSTNVFTVDDDGTLGLKKLLFAALPTCNSGAQGKIAFVTDISGAASFGANVTTGGGTTQGPVTCNGTNWQQH